MTAQTVSPPLDVERLAEAWYVGIQARHGISRDDALRRWNDTDDLDVKHLRGVYADVSQKAAAEYARLTEGSESP